MGMKLKKYKENSRNWIKQIALVFQKLWNYDKRLIWIMLFEIVLNSCRPFPNIVLSKYIIDELIKGNDYLKVIQYTGFMFSLDYIISSLSTLIRNKKMVLSVELTNMLSNDVHKKCMEIDYEMYNDVSTLNKAVFAINLAANNNFISILDGIHGIVTNLVILGGVIAIIVHLDIMLILIAVVVVSLQGVVYFYNIKVNMRLDVESVGAIRSLNYATQLCTKTEVKKDVSIFNMKNYLLDKIKEFQKDWMSFYKRRMNKNSVSEFLSTTCSLGFQCCTYIMLGIKVFSKIITIGSFTMGINSLNSFMDASKGIVKSIIDINSRIYYVSQYDSFLNIDSKFRTNNIHEIDEIDKSNISIEFDHVYFKYPGSAEYVLKDINLAINSHERVAVVGENGAGKTTFVMLLTRMYDPTKGCIRINGIDIREIDYDSYMKLFSTVYQDFTLFPYTISENIVLKKDVDQECRKRVMELFEQNGLCDRLKGMPLGLDTPITKQLDNRGEDLSGGEKQRIAIIRALYKDSPVLILDEPTAALDPLAEYKIYHQFDQMTDKKTAVYISHRIASTRFCDRIVVFSKGSIAELGTFNELMEKEGIYYNFYNKQAEYFSEDFANHEG